MSGIMRGGLRLALSSVRGSKWRSFLTMMGVIVGIVAVVTVVGIGEGVKRQIAGTLNHFGKDLIIVKPSAAHEKSTKAVLQSDILFGSATATVHLTAGDADLVKQTDGVALSAPFALVPGLPKAGDTSAQNTSVIGTSADAAQVLNQKVAYGDMWTGADEDAQFAVLGSQAAEDIFKEAVPLGKSFTFRGQVFQVRGVFDDFNAPPFSPTANFDNAVFIPYKAASRLTGNTLGIYAVLVKPINKSQQEHAIHMITNGLAAAHGGERDFSVQRSSESIEASSDVVHLLTIWITAVAVISLFMGGVGIMNIMLLIVTERMHEIGVRKAVGATGRQILGQFVLEATVLSVFGGAIGIVASLGAIGLLRVYTDFEPVVSWHAVTIATLVSIGIGIVFGVIPAIKAARKDPIEALRQE